MIYVAAGTVCRHFTKFQRYVCQYFRRLILIFYIVRFHIENLLSFNVPIYYCKIFVKFLCCKKSECSCNFFRQALLPIHIFLYTSSTKIYLLFFSYILLHFLLSLNNHKPLLLRQHKYPEVFPLQ